MRSRRRPLVAALLIAVVALSTSALSSPAQAQRATWPVNGHVYQVVYVSGGISWSAANAAANARGGHLATISSAAENAFVFALVDQPLYWNQEPGGSDLGPWLGGYQTSDTGNPNANWVWVDGSAWSYTAWFSGEPNNFTGAAENYLSYKCWGSAGCRSSGWNDLPDQISEFGTSVLSYVIEFDGPVGVDATAPTPGTLALSSAPNPFRGATTIRFELPAAARVRLAITDVAGREVRTLLEGDLPAGSRSAQWDGRNAAGAPVAPGCYFARLSSGGRVRTVGVRLLR